MKTFHEFITEARGKFRGHRTPEEIEALRKKRSQNTLEPQNDETGERLRTSLIGASRKQKDLLKRQLLARQAFYKGRPAALRDTTLDTKKNTAILVKNFSRSKQQLKNQIKDKNTVGTSSHHPDIEDQPEFRSRVAVIMAKRAKRRKKRGMPTREEHRRQRREQEQQSRQRDRDFRKAELKKTVGQIPGQLRDS